MRKKDLLDALGKIDDKYIVEVQKYTTKTGNSDDEKENMENNVMGVEVISKKHTWQKVSSTAAVAAAVILVVGAVAHTGKDNDFKEGSFPDTSISTTEITKDNSNASSLIEYHINIPPVYTMEQVDDLINKGIDKYNRNEKNKISVDKYVSKFKEKQYERDSIELKTYIYHIMLNSVDYYNNAEGSMTYAMNIKAPVDIDFQTDIAKGTSYEKEIQFNKPVCEFYVSDKTLYTIDSTTRKYTEQPCASTIEFIVSDNERVITLDNGEIMTLNRNDVTNLGVSGNSCLFPQSYAMAYLCDFDSWELGRIIDCLERTCVEIKGEYQDQCFKMLVDISTGILMGYEVYNSADCLTGYIKVNSISIDNDSNVLEFDKNQYVLE